VPATSASTCIVRSEFASLATWTAFKADRAMALP
jgi:hypothetical protein